MENAYSPKVLDPNSILVRAGLLAAFRLGMVPHAAKLFLSVRKGSTEKTSPELEKAIKAQWANLESIYSGNGGNPAYLRHALHNAGIAKEHLKAYGYAGNGSLVEVLGKETYINEVQRPLLDAEIDPKDFTVPKALAAVGSLIHRLGSFALVPREKKEDQLPTKKTEDKKGIKPASTNSYNWKWIMAIGLAVSVGTGIAMYESHQRKEGEWDAERKQLKDQVEDQQKAIDKLEANLKKPPQVKPNRTDTLTDAAISASLDKVLRRQRENWPFSHAS